MENRDVTQKSANPPTDQNTSPPPAARSGKSPAPNASQAAARSKQPSPNPSASKPIAAEAVPVDVVPVDLVPIDAIPVDVVPVDVVPVEAVPVDEEAAGLDLGGLDLGSIDLGAELAASGTASGGALEPLGPDLFATETSADGLLDDALTLEPLKDAAAAKQPANGPASAALASAVVGAVAAASDKQDKAKESASATSADAPDQAELVRKRRYLTALPSWAISLTVHVAVLFLLAAMSIEHVGEAIGTALESGGGNEGETLDDTELPGPAETAEVEATAEEFSAPTAVVSEVVAMPQIATTEVSTVAGMNTISLNAATESLVPSSMMGSGTSRMMTSLNGRGAGMRGEMLERFGGNAASEKSVAAALKWIAEHQAPNGGWTFACSRFCKGQCKDDGKKPEAVNAATSLALLPFLGAGQTHLKGQYKDQIKKGLAFLINNMEATPGKLPRGSWHEPGGNMYSHGLAAITICEAYAMTRDPDLVQPAQLALNYLVYAQDPRGGGWWYQPQQAGDTSVAGWCIMALKSGSMANLNVPPESFRGASQFLDFVSTNNGAYYGYNKPSSNVKPSLVAVGLLCRMYMGWPKDNEGVKEGVKLISSTGPNMNDFYYNYYATQVMRHYGGAEWEKWNTKMRDELIKTQSSTGHEAGSWFSAGNHGVDGGRLYSTPLATMILEVYYRHMPFYTEKSSDEDFEL